MSSVRPKIGPSTPAHVTAWETRSGATVYRTATGGWSRDIAEAAVLVGEDAAAALAEAQAEETLVTDPYLMEAAPEGGVAGRETLRETIRANAAVTFPLPYASPAHEEA